MKNKAEKISVDILSSAKRGDCPSENFEEKNGKLFYDEFLVGKIVRRGWHAEAHGKTAEGEKISAVNERNTGWTFIS